MLALLNTILVFLNHIFQLGLKDGLQIYFLSHKRNGERITLNLKKYKYPINLRSEGSDISVLKQVYYYKHYDINLQFKPEIIIDCGANIGLTSVFFKNQYPNAQIIAIEPELRNFELLKINTELYNNIHLERKGVWSHQCNLKIIEGPDKQAWSFHVEQTDEFTGENVIEAVGIDHIVSKYKLDSIDILKIDIEGAEKELFESNYEEWLPKVKVIIIEVHDWLKPMTSKNFLNVISRYDFNIYFKGENIIATKVTT